MSDRERTRVAAFMAVVGAAVVIAGVLIAQVVVVLGWALTELGAISAGHAVLVGLGIVELPAGEEPQGSDRED